MEFINWKLASHPLNWAILFLMVFIGLLALHFILGKFAPQTAAANNKS